MNASRAQLKQLMYGMNNALDVSKNNQQLKPARRDTPAAGIDGNQTITDKQKELLNLELPDSMKFFIIS